MPFRCFTLAFLFAVAAFPQTGANALRRAPSFTLPDQNGKFHDLNDYRGKVVILDIMQTACPHCKSFSAVLEQAKAKYKDNLVVLALVNPPADTPEKVQFYLRENKLTTPILFDCGQAAFSYVRSGSIQLPRVFVIDQAGNIRADKSWTEQTKAWFEPAGLFAELDKLIPAKK
jgi:peroxiredoxin